jgi:hypothetical protein
MVNGKAGRTASIFSKVLSLHSLVANEKDHERVTEDSP